MSESAISTLQRLRFNELSFAPRFDDGEQAEISGTKDGTVLGTGVARFSNASIPWSVGYEEVLLALDGSVTNCTVAGDPSVGPHDCIWLPKGTEVTCQSISALAFCAIYPSHWQEANS